MPNSGRVIKAKEGAKWRYRVELSITDAIDTGCWFSYGGRDSNDQNEPFKIWHKYQQVLFRKDEKALTPAKDDTVWVYLEERTNDHGEFLIVKFKNLQPIQPGRHVAFVNERPSKHSGTFMSGALNPDNPLQESNTLTGEDIAEALALGIDPATLPGATVEAQPEATPATVEDRKAMLLAKIGRIKKAGQAAEEAKALFPEVSLAGKHPDSTDLPH